tara:strand:+ start:600 stop:1640 length:1041 start_codon:yes stop_codon:yes gene_type:complete
MIDYNKLIFAISLTLAIQITLYLFIIFLKNKGIKSSYFAKQKIHEGEVPRVGGLLFFSSFFISHFFIETNYNSLIIPLLIGSLIIFIFSFYEDLKQSLSPYFRLIILFMGSFIFVSFTDLPEINISILKITKKYELITIFLFVFSLMLLMNGFNFIDGLNGLSSFNFLSIISNVFYIGLFYNDYVIVNLSIFIFFVSLFVLFLNFPFGKVFLGDSGSYIYALFSGALIIYLFERQNQLPTLLAMVILAYPITELLFSIFRKLYFKHSPMKPDINHLHHLIFKKLRGNIKVRNNLASLMMLPYCVLPFLFTYISVNYILDYNFYKFTLYFICYFFSYVYFSKSLNEL